MISESLAVWKMAPRSSSFARKGPALARLPLCTSAILPFLWLTIMGWALRTSLPPVVP